MLILYLISFAIFVFLTPLGCFSFDPSPWVVIGWCSDNMASSFSQLLYLISGSVLIWSYYYIDSESYC